MAEAPEGSSSRAASSDHGHNIGGALAQMLSARMVNVVGMAVGFVVLSRLLDPADFGIFALALTAYGATQTLADFGMREYVLRKEEHAPARAVALAALISMVLALVGAATLVGVTRLLPEQYAPQELKSAIVPVALALLIQPLILQREVHLHRAIAFNVPARATIVGVLSEVATGILLALAGYGVMALAWGLFAGQVGKALGTVILSRGGKPVRPEFSDLRPMARFGLGLTGVSILPKLADLILVASLTGLSGTVVTGLYNRANKVGNLLDETLFLGIKPVILPAFASSLRRGKSPADIIASKTCRLLPVMVPGFLGIALLAEPLVYVLLGQGWEEVILAVQILSIGGLSRPVTMMALKVFTAIDRLDAYGHIQTIALTARLVFCVVGAYFSLYAFCAGIVAAMWLKAILILAWERRHINAARSLSEVRAGAAALATVAALTGPVLLMALTDLRPIATLVASGALALPLWLATLRATNHPLWTELGPSLRGLRSVA